MPELVIGSMAVSSSSSKSSNSWRVQRNEFMLALLSTVRPTIAPSSTVNRWAPFIWTHPSSEEPSKRSIQSSDGDRAGDVCEDSLTGSANAMTESPDFVAFLPLPPAAIATY